MAHGKFTLNASGIREFTREADGSTLVVHNYEVGMAAWEGVSKVQQRYRAYDAHLLSTTKTPDGSKVSPVGVTAREPGSTPAASVVASKTDLTNDFQAAGGKQDGKQDAVAAPIFVSYGEVRSPMKETTAPATNYLSRDQGSRMMINTGDALGMIKHIYLSDGSITDIHEVLVVDNADGERKIIFDVDESDIQALAGGHFSIRQVGRDCADDCQPLLLLANQQVSKN